MSHPLFSQPIPTLEEKKQWIKSALSVCDLNETQYAIVEINMIALMLRMNDAFVEYLEYICKCGFYFRTETADVHPVNVYDGNGKFADVVREYCDGVKRYAQTRPGSSETTGEKVCECKSVDVVSERKCPCLEGFPHVCKDGEALLSEPSCPCECHKKSHPIDIVEELTNQ